MRNGSNNQRALGATRQRNRQIASIASIFFLPGIAAQILVPDLNCTNPVAFPFSNWRSYDGSEGGGVAEAYLLRMSSDMSYTDGTEEMMDGPNARTVSNIVSAQGPLNGNSRGLSDIFWQWGQFLDHDVDLTDFSSSQGSVAVPIEDPNDPFVGNCEAIQFDRSMFGLEGGVREQINEITSYIDASNVYGSDETVTDSLRTGTDGLMKTSQDGQMLPTGGAGDDFLAGDIRANEHVGLTSMHTLFVREHNRLAAKIKEVWCDASDEEIFQLARKLVGAEVQIITYREFLPCLLGSEAPGETGAFDSSVDPAIANEFSTVAYRVGHSMLSPEFELRNEFGGEVGRARLRDMFFNPGFFDDALNVDLIIGGQMQKECQQVDPQIIDDVRVFLFDDGCLDLAALNIMRARDHGLMTYNGMRKMMDLGEVGSFADITSNSGLQAKLALAYNNSVDQVDAWIGGLCEDHVAGGVVGPLFSKILKDQFERLKHGDPFWFSNDNDVMDVDNHMSGFWRVEDVSLDKVIRENTIHKSASNVFFAGRCKNNGAFCGDPHFQTWSGDWFDFHGTCDLVFVKDEKFAKGLGLAIHLRTTGRYEYSFVETVAIQIGEDILEVSAYGEHILNGVEQAEFDGFKMGGLFRIEHKQVDKKTYTYDIIISENEEKTEKIYIKTMKDLVSAKFDNAHDYNFGNTVGLMGNFFTGVKLARDGKTIIEDADEFGLEWQVRPEEPMLFQASRHPQLSSGHQCVLPSKHASEERRRLGETISLEDATAACEAVDHIHHENCIYDVMATGDIESAHAGVF